MNAARHKLKFALARNDSGNWTDEFDDEGVVVLRSTEQTVGGGWRIEAPARLRFIPPLPDDAYLREGDIVITKSSGSALHIGKASLVDSEIAALRCTFSNFMQRLRCKREFSPRLVWYFLNSADGRAELDRASLSTTGLANLNGTVIGNLEVAFPAYDDQLRIAAYLDAATGKIDRLMSLRRRQMELLREQRAALIQQAVTRGLNPRAPLKDSGLPWLGQIPKHWVVKRLKFLCNVTTGGKDTIDAEPEGEFPFFVRSQTVERINSYSFDGEAVLTAGDGVGVGKVFHYYNGKLDFHQRVYLLHNFRNVTGKFFFNYLRSLFHSVALGGEAKSTVDSLRMHIFLNFEFCVPPVSEQARIVEWIEEQEAKLDGLHRSYERQLALLAEYRASLIHECVTGQRPVPN